MVIAAAAVVQTKARGGGAVAGYVDFVIVTVTGFLFCLPVHSFLPVLTLFILMLVIGLGEGRRGLSCAAEDWDGLRLSGGRTDASLTLACEAGLSLSLSIVGGASFSMSMAKGGVSLMPVEPGSH